MPIFQTPALIPRETPIPPSKRGDARTVSYTHLDVYKRQAYLKRAFLNDSGNPFNKYKKLGLDCRYAEISLRLRESLSARYALGRYWIEYGKRPKQAYLHLKQCEKQGMDYERLYYYIARCHDCLLYTSKADYGRSLEIGKAAASAIQGADKMRVWDTSQQAKCGAFYGNGYPFPMLATKL